LPEAQRESAHEGVAEAKSLVGALRWPEDRGFFTPKDDPAKNLWFARDLNTMARAKGWGDVAPFYIELETPTGASGVPRAGRLKVSLRNDHLQYALTCFGLAVVLAFVFAFWVRSRPRGAQSDVSSWGRPLWSPAPPRLRLAGRPQG